MIELICPGDLEHIPIAYISRTLGKTESERKPVSLDIYAHIHVHTQRIHVCGTHTNTRVSAPTRHIHRRMCPHAA